MIEIKNLTKNYPSVSVYNNFNFCFEKGKITCVLGESGCGKTTLLNVLAGLCSFEGEVPKFNCSYVFQTANLLPNLTVFQNLKLVNSSETEIDAVLKAFEIFDKKNAYPNQLSGGQKQRVSIARAFLYPSTVILMDEPFSSLDLKLKLSIANLFIKTQQEQKRTALFVTHDIDEAIMLSDRIVILKNGKIKAEFIPKNKNLPRKFGEEETLRKQIINALIKN